MAESAVPGVPHPRTGETVRAYVVPAPGRPVTGWSCSPTAPVTWPGSSARPPSSSSTRCRTRRSAGAQDPAQAGTVPGGAGRHPHGGSRCPVTPDSP
ncbi:hypothetical protein OG559_14840 [Micromonospora sp. NBC_01405]|uniref:hypothetical protein n=1 Tax=Micromonospora sp. NBC_01405 TaxID=2903589 RepID=UPI0032457E14